MAWDNWSLSQAGWNGNSRAFAWIHVGLGRTDQAFDWLDRAVDARDHLLTPIKSYWFLDPIRSDPRYLVLLRRMKLEP